MLLAKADEATKAAYLLMLLTKADKATKAAKATNAVLGLIWLLRLLTATYSGC